MNRPLIALLTDFGLRDSYAGVMKGVILSRCPQARLVDLCHEIPPQDLRAAALCLRQSAPYFPEGTLFVVVVDPGVGTRRRVLWAKNKRHSFLAPDNGVLSWLEDRPRIYRAVENLSLRLKPTSRTFHGRDIFAPAAAALAAGASPAILGPAVSPRARLELPAPRKLPHGRLRGQILATDRFGNAVTSVPAAAAKGRRVFFRGQALGRVRGAYAEVRPGEALALVGSSGFLELSVREGSFAGKFSAAPGDYAELG
ncbi:MAG: SAM-dependent chlorinase/fluorinase [Elusimicrobia bacterium]|nr:SAM-dependent chlorinase/fluorinase [Elusimicrobiota bacterium]